MRVLITGASGFAGGYLARACAEAGDEVLGVSRSGRLPVDAGDGRALDLLDRDGVRALLADVQPDVVYHLAALSSVGRSWEEPVRTVQDNVTSAAVLLEAVRSEAPSSRLVWVSTCEVYGSPGRLPVDESAPLQPNNPYAVSKATGDMLAAVYADAHGLEIVRARPFNHAGPGQLPIFIVSSLAQQAAQARVSGAARIRIVTGNPKTRRDFIDVRDTVRAYRLLADPGLVVGAGADPGAGAGGVYNVCSGTSVSAAEQVRLLAELIDPIEVEHAVDPARIRAHEVMDLRGSHERLTAATGWEPEIHLRQTMSDTIEWWERELVARSGARG